MIKRKLIYIFTIINLFIGLSSFNVGAEIKFSTNTDKINSEMVEYVCRLIIPDNIAEYEYLGYHNPLSFLFAIGFEPKNFDQLKIAHFKRGYISYGFTKIPYAKIKGFEKVAEDLKLMDDFAIGTEIKSLISKLKECHLNYVKDYQKFLDTDGGVYRFVNKVYQRRTHLGKLHRNKTYEGKTYKGNIYSRILKSDYNFDKKICSVPTLEGILDWEVKYANHYTCKYDWDKCNYNGNRSHMGYTIFPLVIKVPMSYDVAKILFGNEYKVFS